MDKDPNWDTHGGSGWTERRSVEGRRLLNPIPLNSFHSLLRPASTTASVETLLRGRGSVCRVATDATERVGLGSRVGEPRIDSFGRDTLFGTAVVRDDSALSGERDRASRLAMPTLLDRGLEEEAIGRSLASEPGLVGLAARRGNTDGVDGWVKFEGTGRLCDPPSRGAAVGNRR